MFFCSQASEKVLKYARVSGRQMSFFRFLNVFVLAYKILGKLINDILSNSREKETERCSNNVYMFMIYFGMANLLYHHQ